jgi:molecular chaperone DnaJ
MAQTAFPRRSPRSDAEVRGFRSSSMMLKEDYYKTLGVSRGADEKDIKTEYRKMAKKYHPDVNKDKGAAEKFAEISEAYEILNDKEKRSAYDSFGHAGVGNGAPGGGPGGFGGGNPFGGMGGGFHQAGGQNMSQEDLFNIFNQAFGGQGRQRGPRKGSDVQMAMGLDFLEAVNGTTMDIRTEYVDVDSSGTRRRKTRNVNVNIPAGVDTGVVLRVSAKGNTGDAGMPPGDLLLHLDVRDDPYFQRNNYDVHVEVPISVSQAILGDTIDVLTLDGMVEMKVPAGTQPDAQLAMKGKGIKAVNSSRYVVTE